MSSNKASACLLAAAVALALAGCATGIPGISGDPLAVLGDGAMAYIVLPVDGNRDLSALFMKKIDDGKNLEKVLDRTARIYAAVYSAKRYRLLAEGDFPRIASPIVFPSSKGWKKTGSKGVGSWYTRDGMDASIPAKDLACVVTGQESGMAEMYAALRNPGDSPVSADFSGIARAETAGGAISVFVTDAAPWVATFLGNDITLPVDHAVIQAIPGEGTGADRVYSITMRIATPDARTARAMTTLIRLAFPDTETKTSGTEISVGNMSATAGKLVDLAGNLYL